jgi:hypothetical protein
MQDLIDLNEWFRHAITGPAQGAWIVWLRVVGELRVEGSGSSFVRCSDNANRYVAFLQRAFNQLSG